MEKEQNEVVNFQNVVGFRHELFATENYADEIAAEKYDEIVNKFNEQIPVLLRGDEGVGKTHFVHQFVRKGLEKKRFDKAIYIDCITGNLNKELIQEIMLSVLREEHERTIDLFEYDFKNEKTVLVFDNIYDFIPTDPSHVFIDKAGKREFEEFILNLCSKEVGVLFIGQNGTEDPIQKTEKVELRALSTIAAMEVLTRSNIIPENIPGFGDVAALTGNPKIVKLLNRQFMNGDTTILEEYGRSHKTNDELLNKDVIVYYELLWKKFTTEEHKQIAVFSSFFNFIVDSFPIAVDLLEKEKKEPCFSELPTCGGEQFRQLLIKLDNLGFLEKRAFGYEMSYQLYLFLNRKKYELSNQQLIVSRIMAFELKVLASFIAQNSEPQLYQRIIQNQARWENALECMWIQNEIPLFSMGKNYLKGILIQGKLQTTYFQWIDRMILKFQNVSLNDNGVKEIAWLHLLIDKLNYSKAEKNGYMLFAAGNYKSKLSSKEINDELLPYQIMFLETFYSSTNDWINRKFVSEQVLDYYQKKNNLEYIVKAMGSLAKCEEQLGNMNRCLAIEESLVHDLDYAGNLDLKKHSCLSIAMNRINRKAFPESIELIEWLEQNSTGDIKVEVATEWVKAEWHLAKEQHELALQKYAHLWNGILKGKHRFNQQKIFERIHKLKQQLEGNTFNEILSNVDNDVLESIANILASQNNL